MAPPFHHIYSMQRLHLLLVDFVTKGLEAALHDILFKTEKLWYIGPTRRWWYKTCGSGPFISNQTGSYNMQADCLQSLNHLLFWFFTHHQWLHYVRIRMTSPTIPCSPATSLGVWPAEAERPSGPGTPSRVPSWVRQPILQEGDRQAKLLWRPSICAPGVPVWVWR